MSIEAMKWATRADVEKSSSKLVLLSLAQLVRYGASEWTAFASIDYLAKITHLNRKTVIQALARLREICAIEDTGARAGANRSCPVYRLCPANVPMIDEVRSAEARFTGAAAGIGHSAGRDPGHHDRAVHEPITGERTDEVVVHGCDEPEQLPVQRELEAVGDAVSRAADSHAPVDAEPYVLATAEPARADAHARLAKAIVLTSPAQAPAPPALEQPSARPLARPLNSAGSQDLDASVRRRAATTTGSAGGGATRLSADWELPPQWRAWTREERPHWGDDKIEAMAATFMAYWRSKPGDAGLSEDWFASWRLWVFRERRASGEHREDARWHQTWSGIVSKGQRLGLAQGRDEPAPAFRRRVHLAAGLPPPG